MRVIGGTENDRRRRRQLTQMPVETGSLVKPGDLIEAKIEKISPNATLAITPAKGAVRIA